MKSCPQQYGVLWANVRKRQTRSRAKRQLKNGIDRSTCSVSLCGTTHTFNARISMEEHGRRWRGGGEGGVQWEFGNTGTTIEGYARAPALIVVAIVPGHKSFEIRWFCTVPFFVPFLFFVLV